MSKKLRAHPIMKFLASLKLAVVVILALGIVSAVGTIYEARYDAKYAQKLVYHSVYMYLVLGLLCVNLIAVMVDRWPWRRRHAAFVLAHIGIIMTLAGAWVTKQFGVDGSMVFGMGQSNRFVSIDDTELLIYSSFQGDRFALMHNTRVDFLKNPPTPDKPLEFNLGSEKLRILGYHHYALRKEDVVESDSPTAGPAIRFQLQNQNVNFSNWLLKAGLNPSESMDLGPAKVTLATPAYQPTGEGNEIVLVPENGRDAMKYSVYSRRQKGLIKSGVMQMGETIATGWMDLEFRLLKFVPMAEMKVDYIPREKPTELTTSAIEVEFAGKKQWVGLNSLFRFYGDTQMYVLSYGNVRLDLGFDLKLQDFSIGRYQGTMKAASYQSKVQVEDKWQADISMNQPLKYKGFTFYQASFQEDESGKPVASILSVNRDPGRGLKYAGCLLIVLGSILLFWFKRLDFLSAKAPARGPARAKVAEYEKNIRSARTVIE